MAKFKVGDVIRNSTIYKEDEFIVKEVRELRYLLELTGSPNSFLSSFYRTAVIDPTYELVRPKFKFPIGSKVETLMHSIWRVSGFDYVEDKYEFVVESSCVDQSGSKFKVDRLHCDTNHKLIQEEAPIPEWKFKIGDKICYKKYKDSQYIILDHSINAELYVMQTISGFKPTHAIGKVHIEAEYELYIPEQPKCVPADLSKSGWHWIKCDHFKRSNPAPKWWNHGTQNWSRTNNNSDKSVSSVDAYMSGWRYDKPLEY